MRDLKSFLFTGGADGFLRAFRVQPDGKTLEPAGGQQTGGLSFFAVGSRLPTGEVRLFVSSKGGLSAWSYDPKKESFQETFETTTAGSGTHVSVAPESGARSSIFLAHYHEHRVSCFSFDERRGFGSEVTLQPGQNPHQTKLIEGSLCVPCLGSDTVCRYQMRPGPDLATQLDSVEPERVAVPGGPRHLAFHPPARLVFALCELSSYLECLSFDAEGRLQRRADWSVPAHPDGCAHWSSDLALSPDGQRLFALHRDPPELVVFSLAQQQRPKIAHQLALTAPIRSFSMDPRGQCLHLGGEDGILHAVSLGGEPSLVARFEGLGPLRHTARVEL